MRLIFFTIILFLNCISTIKAQKQNDQIDAYAKTFSDEKFKDLETFTLALVKPYTSDYDKARVIFAWIGTHIRYDFKKLENLIEDNFKQSMKGASKEEIERKFEDAKEAEMLKCFKTKKGVCEDYSRMYRKMCAISGLECQMITGFAKGLSQRTKNMNHAWNIVKIKDKWHLLDATWGAGYAEDESFKQDYSPGFFMVEPRFFILNHFPNEDKWQFLDKPLTKEEFKRQPWVNYGQISYPIQDVMPLDAPLKIQEGKVSIKIKFSEKPPVLIVYSLAGKQIATKASQSEGYTILTFEANSYPFVFVGIGKSLQDQKIVTIAKFYLDNN